MRHFRWFNLEAFVANRGAKKQATAGKNYETKQLVHALRTLGLIDGATRLHPISKTSKISHVAVTEIHESFTSEG